MKFVVNEVDSLDRVVSYVKEQLNQYSIVLLKGEMGVGKTTFTQKLLTSLGIKDLEGSPTYSLINEYELPSGQLLYHMDLYRLKNIQEAFDIGIEDVLNEGSICVIEWPDLIEKFLDGNYLVIQFTLNENLSRNIVVGN